MCGVCIWYIYVFVCCAYVLFVCQYIYCACIFGIYYVFVYVHVMNVCCMYSFPWSCVIHKCIEFMFVCVHFIYVLFCMSLCMFCLCVVCMSICVCIMYAFCNMSLCIHYMYVVNVCYLYVCKYVHVVVVWYSEYSNLNPQEVGEEKFLSMDRAWDTHLKETP